MRRTLFVEDLGLPPCDAKAGWGNLLGAEPGSLREMKVILALSLIVLLLFVALPIGMNGMAECPACTSATAPFAVGLCAGILSLIALIVVLSSGRLRLAQHASHRFLLALSIFRPPRFA